MNHYWDEFSKSLAEKSVPRRESLRLLGAALAGALLGPLGVRTAWAGGDPCKAFCNRCRTKSQQNQCLAACRACNGNTGRLGGSCGSYVCCPTAACSRVCSDLRSDPNCGACGNDCSDLGETCCGNYCADLANDFDNCGACGAGCAYPGQHEDGACVDGHCAYACVPGAIDCDGICTPVNSDPNNCGACGNVCPESAPYCGQGVCVCASPYITCGGVCVDPTSDRDNCGGCGQVCPEGQACNGGLCCNPDCTPDHPYYPNCGTVCGDPCLTFWTGLTWCDPSCVDLRSDPYNCGACGNTCSGDYYVCSSGACWDPSQQF